MKGIGSKTNSSLKLQTSNSFLYLDLGRLRRAGTHIIVLIFLNIIYSLNGQSISTKSPYSFKKWQKNQEVIEKLNKFNSGFSRDSLTNLDTFYAPNNISFENIFFDLATYFFGKGQKQSFEKALILAVRNGSDPKTFNFDRVTNTVLADTLENEYKNYLSRINIILKEKISSMIELDQGVRRIEPINYEEMRIIDSVNQNEFKNIIFDLNRWPASYDIGKQLDPSIFVMHTMRESDVIFFLTYLIESCQNGYSSWKRVISILSHRILRLKTYQDGSKSFLYLNQNEDLEELEIHSIGYILNKLPNLKVSFCLNEIDLQNRIFDTLTKMGIPQKRIYFNNCTTNSYKVYF